MLCLDRAVPANPSSLTSVLQQVRKERRWSQLELSFRLGVSQRHVSFVESGRSTPSRGLLLAWLHALDTPLALRNHALLQAGYAPAYGDAPIDDPALATANDALEHLLRAHDPMPAMVLDSLWNVVRVNRGAEWLAGVLLPGLGAGTNAAPLNLLEALAHPDGLTRLVVNLKDVGPAMLARLRQEALAHPAIAPKVEAFADLLRSRLGPHATQPGGWAQPAAPVLTTRYATDVGELAFFSMYTTFGTPQEITLASLRVEHLFAADAATRAVIDAHVR